jgi:hypothetical protein
VVELADDFSYRDPVDGSVRATALGTTPSIIRCATSAEMRASGGRLR